MAQRGLGLTRRTFLGLGLALAAPLASVEATRGLVAGGARRLAGHLGVAQVLPPTPACGDSDEPTSAQTEGPYYRRDSPERTSLLEPGVTGTRLVITGSVLTRTCRPIARALLDFWQADASGQYDNRGYRLRGHQFTDTSGQYTLETIMPGLYTGRTRHIHVKVQAPGQPVLTTQLYFPHEPRNATDPLFRPSLLLALAKSDDGLAGTFHFVLDVA
jgi:hypothetical protein